MRSRVDFPAVIPVDIQALSKRLRHLCAEWGGKGPEMGWETQLRQPTTAFG